MVKISIYSYTFLCCVVGGYVFYYLFFFNFHRDVCMRCFPYYRSILSPLSLYSSHCKTVNIVLHAVSCLHYFPYYWYYIAATCSFMTQVCPLNTALSSWFLLFCFLVLIRLPSGILSSFVIPVVVCVVFCYVVSWCFVTVLIHVVY